MHNQFTFELLELLHGVIAPAYGEAYVKNWPGYWLDSPEAYSDDLACWLGFPL